MATKLFLLLILLSHVASSLSEWCHPEDKKALLQIKKELNNPTILSSWKPHTDCCKLSWYGVTCFRRSNNNNRVRYLSISNDTKLISQFPPSIGNLPYLESLFLYQLPNLTGPIPIKPLTKLKYLTITSTGISGPIPNLSAQMKNLVHLDLSSNHLSGTLPPSLYQLPKLGAIFFYNNKLTGSIPLSYGYFNNKNLPSLLLSHNQLSGRLPISLGRLNTTVIELSCNRFEGDASMLFGSNKATREIHLSGNLFAFDLGKVELSTKTLTTLDVSRNQIYGKLPVGIENILSLNVSFNRLCGEIPKGGNMKRFGVNSFFHNKCLCGSPLPRCKK